MLTQWTLDRRVAVSSVGSKQRPFDQVSVALTSAICGFDLLFNSIIYLQIYGALHIYSLLQYMHQQRSFSPSREFYQKITGKRV